MNIAFEDLKQKSLPELIYNESFEPSSSLGEHLNRTQQQFLIQNLIPQGWTLRKCDGGRKSLESFLNYWYVNEWVYKGIVDRNNPKYPYNLHKLCWLMYVILGFNITESGTFLQCNNRFLFRQVDDVSRKLSSYFTFLNNYGQNSGIRIFCEFFDTTFWTSKHVLENPQFMKRIRFSNKSYSDYFTPIDTTNFFIMRPEVRPHGYTIMKTNYSFADWSRPESQTSAVYSLIESKFKRAEEFVSNAEILEVMRKFLPSDKSDKFLLKAFDSIALEIGVLAKSKATRSARGRTLTIIKPKVVGEPESVYDSNILSKI